MSWCLQTKCGEHQTNATQALAERNPSRAARIDKTAFLRFFLCFPILSRVRKLGSKNRHRFVNLRTFC